MLKYKIVIAILSGLLVLVSAAWITGWPFHHQKAAVVTPVSVESGAPGIQPGSAAPCLTATVSAGRTAAPSATPSAASSPTAVPTPTPTAAPTNTPSPTDARTPSPAHTPSPTAAPTATPTPEPTPPFTYTVYNDDGVAPAGYTIVYVKIKPNGSYHVTYDGSTITKSKSGSDYITYYTTVEKLEDGGYRSKVRVTAG
jgi:hypothetical protein